MDTTKQIWDSLQAGDIANVLRLSLQRVPCYLDPTLPIIDIARALATEGMCLANDDRGHLMITRLQGYEPIVKPITPTQDQVDSDLFDGAFDGSGEGEPLPRGEDE